jgi:hypothetical protein
MGSPQGGRGLGEDLEDVGLSHYDTYMGDLNMEFHPPLDLAPRHPEDRTPRTGYGRICCGYTHMVVIGQSHTKRSDASKFHPGVITLIIKKWKNPRYTDWRIEKRGTTNYLLEVCPDCALNYFFQRLKLGYL